MGAQFPNAFPDPLRAAAKASLTALLPALALGLLAGCISDGPNQTGGKYLSDHGVLLENPLYHVTLKGFPVDSSWFIDNEPGHVNDSLLLAGRAGRFTAEPRFVFQIEDTAYLDSIGADESTFRLSLASPTWKDAGIWKDNGDAVLRGLADSARDSLAFEVLSWDFTDSGLTGNAWKDSLGPWNRRFFFNSDTTAVLPAPAARDTIVLNVRGAYATATQQHPLPNLHALLAQRNSRKHSIQMRLVPAAPSGASDTVPAMLRLGGNWARYDVTRMPLLLVGHPDSARTSVAKNRIAPASLGTDAYAVTYTLRYSGPRDALVVPKARGLHVTFDRARLLDSLDAALVRQGKVPAPRTTESLSLAYFVPFAAVTLPIQPASLEGGLPVEVKLITAVDTLLGDTLTGASQVTIVRLGEKQTPWYTTEAAHPDRIRNRISLAYDATGDADLRRVILAYSTDSSLNDTVYLPVGGTTQLKSSSGVYGTGSQIFLDVEAAEDSLIARSYVNTHTFTDKSGFRDPATGEDVTVLDSLIKRFVQPQDSAIRLRATAGVQALLNRTRLGTSAREDFEFRPTAEAFNPAAVNTSNDTLAHQAEFPVLTTLVPRTEGGVLKVDLEVYLYPLRAR
jgi:hypothetical protein